MPISSYLEFSSAQFRWLSQELELNDLMVSFPLYNPLTSTATLLEKYSPHGDTIIFRPVIFFSKPWLIIINYKIPITGGAQSILNAENSLNKPKKNSWEQGTPCRRKRLLRHEDKILEVVAYMATANSAFLHNENLIFEKETEYILWKSIAYFIN